MIFLTGLVVIYFRDNLISACKVKDKVAVAKILDEVVRNKQVEQVLNLRNKVGVALC